MSNDQVATTQPFFLPESVGVVVERGNIDPKLLHVSTTNCRSVPISKNDELELFESIKVNGVINDLIINTDNAIIDGKLRWTEAIKLNVATVPFKRIKFTSSFHERVASISNDCQSHRLHPLDLHLFVKNCIEIEHKSYEEISKATSKHIETIRGWARFKTVPNTIAKNEESVKKLLELSNKKQFVVRSILNKESFKKDVNKASDLMEYASVASRRDLEVMRKDINAGIAVDPVVRKKRVTEKVAKLEVKIPVGTYTSFMNKCKATQEDYFSVIERLVINYVREE